MKDCKMQPEALRYLGTSIPTKKECEKNLAKLIADMQEKLAVMRN
jgi:hypothetical protein